MKVADLRSDPLIKDWFRTRALKDATKDRYLEAMKYFTEMTKKTPIELIEEAESEIKEGKVMRLRKIKAYLLDFKDYLNGHYAPTSRETFFSAVRSFYQAYEIDLPRNLLKADDVLPLQRNQNHSFNKDIIRRMLHHANVRDQAIILTMKSSGMARREIIDLTYRQFREGYDRESKIAVMHMRRAKVNTDFVTFIDPEGTLAIIEYLRKTRRYFSDGFSKKFDETPLFMSLKGTGKIDEKTFDIIFWLLAQDMGLHTPAKTRETRKFNAIHSHNLRKFFRTTLLHSGMDDFLIHYLMGHKVSALNKAYFLEDAEKLKESYMAHMHALAINSGTNADLIKEHQRLKAEIERLKAHDMTEKENMLSLLDDFRRMIEKR